MDDLDAKTDRLHQEHRDRQRALFADIRQKKDALREWFEDSLRGIDRQRNNLILQLSSAAHLGPSRGIPLVPELEAVTSSSPADTGHLLEDAPSMLAEHFEAGSSGLCGLPDNRPEPLSDHQTCSEAERVVATTNFECTPDAHPVAFHAAPDSKLAIHKRSIDAGSLQTPAKISNQDSPTEDIEIDVSHVIPVAEQRDPGTTTYMFCRPRTRRVRLHRTWRAQLWGPVGLDPVEADTQVQPQPHTQRKLQTNDEALVENKTVASLAGQSDMTPDLWSEMLSPGPGNLCWESRKAIKHDLWQNQLWLKRKAEATHQADSDEDDTEQFGIQEGDVTTVEAELAGAPADDDEGDAYPLYGEDDSDFGNTGSDAEGSPQQSRGAEEDLSKSDAETEQVSLEVAYRSILEGTGLSAEALQTWMEPWMKHVTADIVALAKGGIACLIPGSKAAELIVESRLGRAVVMIAENLHTMQQHWEQTQLPQLGRKSYKLWRQGQNPTQIQTWQGDAEHWRGQVAKLVHEVAVIHVGKARLPVRAIKKSSRSIQQMYVNLQEVVFKLTVIELLQEPGRPSRKCPAPARSGEGQSHAASAVSNDSRSRDDDNLSGSWLVDDEADANEAGAAEVTSKRRHVDLADNSKSVPAGQTEVLVAPGLEQQHQAHLEQSGQATANEQSDSQASLPAARTELTVDLDDDGDDANVALHKSRPEASDAPSSQDLVDPDLQAAQVPAGITAEGNEQLEGNDAGSSQIDCDMHSIVSDGADSYKGLPVDQVGQQAAVASSSGHDADSDSPMEDVSKPSEAKADTQSEADKGQQLETQCDSAEAAAVEDALPQPAPEPAGDTVNVQQHAQTGRHVAAAGISLDKLQAAVSDSGVETTQTTEQVNEPSSLAGTVEAVAPLGIWVEVCSRPAVGQWSWQLASFQAAALPASGLVSVTYKASPSELPFSVKSELVNVANVRHMAPSATYVKALSELQRGAAVEVDMGDGKLMCAVLVAKTQHLRTALGQQQGIERSMQSFERALENVDNSLSGTEGTACIVYSPELRSFLSVPMAFLGTRLCHAMSWSPGQESFVSLSNAAKAELLEGCSLDGSGSSTKRVAARRDAAALHVFKAEQRIGASDAELRWRFTRRYLARQPNLPFKRTKTLLSVQPTPAQKKRIADLTAGPMKGVVAGTRSPSGNKRKRNSNPPGRRQPDERAEAGASQREQRQELGRQQREADALKQQEKLRKRKEKKERRQSLAANTAAPRSGHVAQTDAGALPLFPEQKTDTKVMVAGCMATQLKPHQWTGVRFLWTNIVLDFEDPDNKSQEDAGGCILAHSMGLGKSLQTIAFLHTFFTYYPDQRSLLLVPSNVLHNWDEEFHHWLPQGKPETDDELAPSKVIIYKKAVDVHTWMSKKATVLIISYDMFSALRKQSIAADLKTAGSEPSAKAVAARQAFQALVNEAGVVVADEGHQIKNPSTKRFAAVTSLKTKRRIALTGYPLQNNMDEYYTMIMWCMDDLLGDAVYFHNTFSKPIQEGQVAGASTLQVQHMYQQLSVLANLTEGFIHRVGPEQLFKDLPAKHENVVLLCLDTAQQAMYKAYLEAVEKYGRDTLMDTTFLHLLSHRPKEALKRLRSMQEGNAMQIEDAVKEAVVEGHVAQPHAAGQSTGAELARTPSSDSQGRDTAARTDTPEAARTDTPEAASDREAEATGTKGQHGRRSRDHKLPPEAVQQLLAVAGDLADKGTALGKGTTAKAWAVQHILHSCEKREEKLVIFSQYLMDLDELEHMLQQKFQWSKGKQYLRLDGNVSPQTRQQHTRLFNDTTSSVQVYLISTKAGSVGINLTAAFRMIIYDELWNPVHNAQAIARIYRYGQKRATFVYRLLYKGTAEHRVYRRNVDKEGLFMKVVDKQTVKGTNKLEDVDIYAFDPPAPADKGTLHNVVVNSTDEVLKSLLRTDLKHDRWIAGWENHKENLPEDPSQKLTAEQRREAAKRYTLEQDTTRGSVAGAEKRKRLVRKRFADDEDFQLTTAETALLAKQAAELQDYDQLPTAATQQAPPVVPVKGSADAPALKHSASMPATTAATKAAAPAETTAPEAVRKRAHPVLLHSASMLTATTEAVSAAADEAKTAADETKVAAEKQASPQLPAGLQALLNRIPSSPLSRSTQELHSGAKDAAPAAADGAATAAAPAAADGSAAAAAPAELERASQKSKSKIWRPPFAATSSPQSTSEQQAASSTPAGTPAREPLHTQATSRAAAGVSAEKRSLTEGSASPWEPLADQVSQRMLSKKRKCTSGEWLDSQVKRHVQAIRDSKSANFRLAVNSLGCGSQGKEAMGMDEGPQKEKTNMHAGRSLQAVAAQQMAEALSKKKQNRSAGIQTSSGKQQKSIPADSSPNADPSTYEDKAGRNIPKEAAGAKLAAPGGDQPMGKLSDSSLAVAEIPFVDGTSRPSSGADKSSDNATKQGKSSDNAAKQGKSSGDAGDKTSEQSDARQNVRLPEAPLFVAGSPAGANCTVQWVQQYKLEHPECSDAEALTAWRAARSLALRKTPDQRAAERHHNMDSVRSSLPQLTGSAKASHALSQTQAATPHASQAQQAALDKPKAAAVPLTGAKGDTGFGLNGSQGEAVAKQGTSGMVSVKAGQGRGAVATSASGQPAAARAHEEHATCGSTSASAHGKLQERYNQKLVDSAPKAKRDDSASCKPESQMPGKHAASASGLLSKEGSQKAGSDFVKKRRSREQRPADSRVPVQQPKGIPALEGRARVHAGKGPKGNPTGTQPPESQIGKRHKGQFSVADKEGSSKPHTGKRPKGKSPDAEAEPHGKSVPAQEDRTAGMTSAKAPEASRAQKRRCSTSSSPDLSQTAQLGSPVVMPSPGAFPELSQASRFAALSPRTNQLSSPPPQKHTPKGHQIGSPTLQEIYSRHKASHQSPKAPQPTPSSVAVWPGPESSAAKLLMDPAGASLVDPSLVKHGAELLSEALQSSSPDSVADSKRAGDNADGSSKGPNPAISASSRQKPESQSLPVSSHQAAAVAESSLARGSAQRPGLQNQRDDKQAVPLQGLKRSKSDRKRRRESQPVLDGDLIDLTDV
ncbi:hypothetical protein WJX77_010974 [Trebouxia sp. C0004]